MLKDYIAMKQVNDAKKPLTGRCSRKPIRNSQQNSHHFDTREPWAQKFPQRRDTMSQSTLNEEKDGMKLYANRNMRTKRNYSLNLLSKDINGK